MKNYYEILEVNKKASKEVIEKAYKVLAKKYHPDLQKEAKSKAYAEKKIKDVNEAYRVLSNDFLREQYDSEIENEKEKNVRIHQMNAKKESNIKREIPNIKRTTGMASIIELTKQLIENIKELSKSREKREELKENTTKNVIAIILTIIVVILIGIVFWFIPFTNGWIRQLLFENPLLGWMFRK